jgi:transcriptional regulator with XRE-family HTH domain
MKINVNKLRRLRRRAGLSQRALAGLARVGQSDYCQIERGRRSVGGLRLQRIARALGVTMDELIR